MNAVWNSYGQLCGCPEIFKKSCKFFCRELDIRVTQVVNANALYTSVFAAALHLAEQVRFRDLKYPVVRLHSIQCFDIVLYFVTEE